MFAYVRASKIPVPKETLVRGVGGTVVVRFNTAGQGGAGFRMTGQVWFGSGEAGPAVEAEGASPDGRDAKSSGIKVGGDEVVFEGGAGLAAKAGWGVSCLRTALLATLYFKVEFF